MPPLFILRKSRSIYPGDTKRHNGERNTAQETVFPQENRLPRRVVYIGKRAGEEGLSDGKRKSCRFGTENKKNPGFRVFFRWKAGNEHSEKEIKIFFLALRLTTRS